MNENNSFEWCELVSICELDYRKDGERTYHELLDMIRAAADGAFDICDTATCRSLRRGMAVKQVKDLPWNYLFQCIKISDKDFQIKHPPSIARIFLKYIIKENAKDSIYAWYDSETDGIKVLAYTGRSEDEENTYPAYDGYGRYDTYYEIVEGVISPEGDSWIVTPKTRYVGLYG